MTHICCPDIGTRVDSLIDIHASRPARFNSFIMSASETPISRLDIEKYDSAFTDRSEAVLLLRIIYVISVLFLLCFRARLFIDALWSPAGKGLTSWLSLVMSNCDVVTFPLVRCGG